MLFPPNGKPYLVPDGCGITATSDADYVGALSISKEYLLPASKGALLKMATYLRTACKSRAEGEETTETQIKIYADALGKYPADIAREVVSEWTMQEKFIPAVADIHERARTKLAIRQSITRAIEKRRDQAREDARERITPEQAAKIAESHGREF